MLACFFFTIKTMIDRVVDFRTWIEFGLTK